MVQPSARQTPGTVSGALARWLADHGVRLAFGVSGGGVAGLWDALCADPGVEVIHTQHEGGAAFAAAEASLAGDLPVAVFTTTGPGLTNALTGLVAAREEGARLIVLSGVTPAPRRFHGATQESGPSTALAGLSTPGAWFDLAATVECPAMLGPLLQRAGEILARPEGGVIHLALPTDLQTEPARGLPPRVTVEPLGVPDPEPLAAVLRDRRVAMVVGFGARRAASDLVRLAERLDAPVVVTPRAKGVFPEGHPLWRGVVGFGGHEAGEVALMEHPPEVLLVLGTWLGEPSRPGGAVWEGLDEAIVVDPRSEARLSGLARTRWVRAPVRPMVRGLLRRLPERPSRPLRRRPVRPRSERLDLPAIIDAVERVVIDGSDALVLAEAGNSFAWAIHRLRLDAPRLRVSVGWGSMGQATSGVLGAALGARRRAVAVVGDGALLMGHELATAAHHGVDATWIVADDQAYGMCLQGTRRMGFLSAACDLPRVDFAALARSMGVRARRVDRVDLLDAALAEAIEQPGPSLVHVPIVDCPAPMGRRVAELTFATRSAS